MFLSFFRTLPFGAACACNEIITTSIRVAADTHWHVQLRLSGFTFAPARFHFVPKTGQHPRVRRHARASGGVIKLCANLRTALAKRASHGGLRNRHICLTYSGFEKPEFIRAPFGRGRIELPRLGQTDNITRVSSQAVARNTPKKAEHKSVRNESHNDSRYERRANAWRPQRFLELSPFSNSRVD